MSIEDRVTILEQGLRGVQGDFLVHLSENNRHMAALNKVITQQEVNSRDVDHNLAMLLGMLSGQGKDIKSVMAALADIREHVTDIEQDNAEFYIKFDHLENQQIPAISQDIKDLHTKIDRLENRFDRLEKLLLDRLPPL